MIIGFKSSKDKLFDKKYKRYKELNGKYFMQNITDSEEIEWIKLEQWIKLHK